MFKTKVAFLEGRLSSSESEKSKKYSKSTGQIAQVIRRLLLVREVWGPNPEPIKSPIHCQRLATAATLMCGPWRKPLS